MDEVLTQAFWIGLAKIIGINIVLSGDNAVVIALAARSLPPAQQKKAIFWGSAAAMLQSAGDKAGRIPWRFCSPMIERT